MTGLLGGCENASAAPSRQSWVSRSIVAYFAVAVLLAVPCFWQARVQANDLSSHLYSAWLVSQVAAGNVAGLYIERQSTNLLFDLMLESLLTRFGPLFAERAALIVLVETLFWGWFALASVVSGRPAWGVVPLIAMMSYGAVFRLGLMNFYLSVALAIWAIVIVCRFGRALVALPVLAAAYIAHVIPFAWALFVIGYILAAQRWKAGRLWLFSACTAGVAALSMVISFQFPSSWTRQFRVASIFGADQLLTYGSKYKILAAGWFCCCILLLARRLERSPAFRSDAVLQLWTISAAACLLLPDAVKLPGYDGTLSFITLRLSLLAAIPLTVSIAMAQPGRLYTAALLLLATGFFIFSYADERRINAVEDSVAAAVAILPTGSRVLSNLTDSHMYVPALNHLASRPCIGRCFDFGHYEPATRQFRLRASHENQFVISDMNEIRALERGEYVFNRSDLVVFRFMPCSPPHREICAAPLRSGEIVTKTDLAVVR